MQITLLEDDSIFFDGVPKNVVLSIVFDDGSKKRLPYSAEKSIAALYEDISRIAPMVSQLPQQEELQYNEPIFLKSKLTVVAPTIVNEVAKEVFKEDKSHVIEKEDIVTLIKLEDRGEGASCDLVVGQEYRVISVIQSGVTLPGQDRITQIVHGYDVVNDHGDRPERTRVFPHEVTLKRKRIPPPAFVKSKVEEILHCPHCDAINALALDGITFKGVCSGCQQDIAIERVIKKCKTEKCGNEVSCFDIGGKYQGNCNKCKSIIEVPYE